MVIASSHGRADVRKMLNRVLVVDDVHLNRKMLRRTLESRAHTVAEAIDGVEALRRVRVDQPYDLITMDYQMPNMDGPTATALIRKEGYLGVIIGVTGNMLQSDVEHFLGQGVDAVLPKPLNISEFEECIERCLVARALL
eukprot:gene36861-biopygen31412